MKSPNQEGGGKFEWVLVTFSLLYVIAVLLAVDISRADAEVTDVGSYQYSISITVPKFHEITPEIGLTYDSNTVNGPLGNGWSLSAGSRITRSSKPMGVPHYDAKDQLWLDGMELESCEPSSPPIGIGTPVRPNSVSCKTGGTHTTRVENFNRIIQDITNNSWTIWGRDGTRFVYHPRFGDVSSPFLTHQWVLSHVIDTHGNRVAYEYTCGGGLECYISEITYGDGKLCKPEPDRPVGATLPGVLVKFYWQLRPDPQSTAVGGELSEIRLRLRAIDILEGNKRVRVYQVNYRQEFTGDLGYTDNRSWINSIQMFGSDAELDPSGSGTVVSGTSSPPYKFEAPSFLYSSGPSFSNTFAGNHQFTPAGPTNLTLPSVYNDRLMPVLPASSMVIRTYRPHTPMAIQTTNYPSMTLGDFDGDRKPDFMQWATNGNCSELKTRTMMAAGTVTIDRTYELPEANLCSTMAIPADLDADGRIDILFLRFKRIDPYDPHNLTHEAQAISAISNGNGTYLISLPTTLWTAKDDAILLQSRCAAGDTDGDGRTDLVCSVKEEAKWVIIQASSTGYGHFKINYDRQSNGLTDLHDLALGDVDGDGLSDLIVVDQRLTSGNSKKIHLATGISGGGGTFVWQNQPSNIDPTKSNQMSRILLGDFNGDARSDVSFVIVNDDGSGGSITTFLSDKANFLIKHQKVVGRMFMATVGDRDGDGLEDLLLTVRQIAGETSCGPAVGYDHQAHLWALSRGDGTFMLPESIAGCYPSKPSWRWPLDWGGGPISAYVNADSIADEMNFYVVMIDGNLYFKLVDQINSYIAHDFLRWRSADVNGDGRADWVYINYGNPGLIILTQIAQPDGTRHLVRSDVAPSTGNGNHPDLVRPDPVSNWFLVDVGGGPNDSSDGKADIVLVDDISKAIITLLANGDGTWKKIVTSTQFKLSSILRGNLVSPETGDISNWRALDINGDGLTDLVHVAFMQPIAEQEAILNVTTLLAAGDGHWNAPTTGQYKFGGNLSRPDVRGFLPSDINGDGRMDLVKVERNVPGLPLGHNTTIWSLIAHGDGSWEDRYRTVVLPNGTPRQWWPMEINGDGRTDIAYLTSKPGESLSILTLLSLGDGQWEVFQKFPVTPVPVVNDHAITNFRIFDLDHDGKQDIIHISVPEIAGKTATMVIWNRYPYFTQKTTTSIPLSYTDFHAWNLLDVDGDDYPELVRIRTHSETDLDVITIPVLERRLTLVKNGLGGSDEIAYGTSVGKHFNMPLGQLAHVVKRIGTRAISSPAGLFVVLP